MRGLHIYKFIILVLIVAVVGGCSDRNQSNPESASIEKTTDTTQSPFEGDQQDSEVMGSMSHQFSNLAFDRKGEVLPLQYNGGEISIDYSVRATGKAKNVGFLVFIDGIAQPYKVNTTEAPYEYLHIFELEEDDKETPFSFVFTPVTGKKGETLHVSITSIYNPGFRPDMKETSSYGGYHKTLEAGISLVFNQDAEKFDYSAALQQGVLDKVETSTEPITQELLEKSSPFKKLTIEDAGKKVYFMLLVDNEERNQNYHVNKNGTLHVTFKTFGHPGIRYKNTFYVNHKALASKDISSYETSITEGNVSVIDAEIQLDHLEELSTFYVVSVPMNATDFPNDVILLTKTPSLLLYK